MLRSMLTSLVLLSNAGALSPEDAVDAAISVHPTVLAAQAELARARGAHAQLGGLLANPSVSGRLATDGSRSGAALTQPISLTAEGKAARKAAHSRVQAATHALRRARLEASADTRSLYVDAVVATALVDVARSGLDLSARLHQAARRRLEEGAISELDLRLARLSEVDAARALLDAQAVQAEALQQLSSAVGALVDPDTLTADPRSAAPTPTTATHARSDLLAARTRLTAADAELARQRAATLSPVGVGAFVGTEDGETFAGPTLQLTLPVFDRNQAARSEAAADRAVAQGSTTALAARIASEQHNAADRTRAADALEALLEADPTADAQAALDSLEAGYAAGELDLPQTLLLQRQVLDGQAAIVHLQAAIARARIDLLLATDDPSLTKNVEHGVR